MKAPNKTTKDRIKCPKCGSRYGVKWIKDKNKVICFHGRCDWFTTVEDWNKKNPKHKFNETN